MRRARFTPFTPREHLAAGARLSSIERQLGDLMFAVDDAYGRRLSDKLLAIERKLSMIKSALDDAICSELPRSVTHIDGVPVVAAYYGWQAGPYGNATPRSGVGARAELSREAETITEGNPWTEAERQAARTTTADRRG